MHKVPSQVLHFPQSHRIGDMGIPLFRLSHPAWLASCADSPSSLPLDVEPEWNRKDSKGAPFFFLPFPHCKAHVPSRVPTQIACRDSRDGHRTDAACAREIIIEHGAGRTTMTLSSTTRSRHPSIRAAKQSTSPPAAASLFFCPAECPPSWSLTHRCHPARYPRARNRGWALWHFIRGLMSGCRTPAAPWLPTFPSFADSAFMEVRTGLP